MGSHTRSFDNKFSTLLLIALIYPMGPAAIILMPMIVGGVIDGYGFTQQQAGNIASIEGVGVVIASFLSVLWLRKLPWNKVIFVCFLLMAVLNVISANLNEYIPLLITRGIVGIIEGSVFAVAVAALGDTKEPDKAFGVAQAIQGLFMFAGFASAPYLIQNFGLAGFFYLFSATSVVMMLTVFRFPEQGIDHVKLTKEAHGDNHTVLIWLGVIASFIFCVNIFGIWAFIERIGQAALLSSEDIGFALGLSQVFAIGGGLATAMFSDRFGRILPLLVVVIGQSLALWVLIGQFTSFSFYIATGVFQALFVVGISYQMGMVAKLDVKGKFLVIVTAAQGLGAAFGPSITATLISDGNDYSSAIEFSITACIVSILVFLYIEYRSQHLYLKAEAT